MHFARNAINHFMIMIQKDAKVPKMKQQIVFNTLIQNNVYNVNQDTILIKNKQNAGNVETRVVIFVIMMNKINMNVKNAKKGTMRNAKITKK